MTNLRRRSDVVCPLGFVFELERVNCMAFGRNNSNIFKSVTIQTVDKMLHFTIAETLQIPSSENTFSIFQSIPRELQRVSIKPLSICKAKYFAQKKHQLHMGTFIVLPTGVANLPTKTVSRMMSNPPQKKHKKTHTCTHAHRYTHPLSLGLKNALHQLF